jgi:hypothetical protein
MDDENKNAVDTRVAVVWPRKIASIAAPIAKQSRPAPKFPASVGIAGRVDTTGNRTYDADL